MDDDDFDDLLDGAEYFEGSSQESLTTTAANLIFCDKTDREGGCKHDPVPLDVTLKDRAQAEENYQCDQDGAANKMRSLERYPTNDSSKDNPKQQ